MAIAAPSAEVVFRRLLRAGAPCCRRHPRSRPTAWPTTERSSATADPVVLRSEPGTVHRAGLPRWLPRRATVALLRRRKSALSMSPPATSTWPPPSISASRLQSLCHSSLPAGRRPRSPRTPKPPGDAVCRPPSAQGAVHAARRQCCLTTQQTPIQVPVLAGRDGHGPVAIFPGRSVRSPFQPSGSYRFKIPFSIQSKYCSEFQIFVEIRM
jgi:hypothetical protein